MNVMLLAAGEGTRLRPYTNILPKPAMPFLNAPLAAHALSFIKGLPNSEPKIGIDKLVVNTFHLPEKIHSLFHSIAHEASALYFSDEVNEILGSGGGLQKARHHFIGGDDFILMNADEVILPEHANIISQAMAHHKSTNALATLLVIEHAEVGSQFGGVWANQKNEVSGFGKVQIDNNKGWHFVGVQILSERVFEYIPDEGPSNILYDALTKAIGAGEKIQVFPFQCTWFETGNPTDFFKASEKCFKILADSEDSVEKQILLNTINKNSRKPTRIEKKDHAEFLLANNTEIDETSLLSGIIIAGENSKISSNCVLHNVVVAANVTIPTGTTATNSLFLQ